MAARICRPICLCRGVGEAVSGEAVAWNVVTGMHDADDASERTVWIDGEPHEIGAVTFGPELSGITFAEGGSLAFTGEAAREHRENLLLVATDYAYLPPIDKRVH